MKSQAKELCTEANWPPAEGQIISFQSSIGQSSSGQSSNGFETMILKEVRWGLVWRDFILTDGRVIPEHRVSGCPHRQVWRKIDEVTDREREECEERLFSMAGAGMDPRKRDLRFWAELNGIHIPQVQAGWGQSARHSARQRARSRQRAMTI